jgi:hypothetical protein
VETKPNKEGFRRFLRDVAVSLIGVLIAALISLCSVFYVYDYQNSKQCNSILEMVIEENTLNEVRCKNILKRLKHFVGDDKTVEGSIFTIRLLSRATSFASESELITRYVPPRLRSRIYVHCENVCTLNANLDNFNDYLKNHIDDPKVNLRFLKEWAGILIQGTNSRSSDSKELAKQLSQYLSER